MQFLKTFTQRNLKKHKSKPSVNARRGRVRIQFEKLEQRLLFAADTLLHETDLDYVGAFRVPQGKIGNVGQATFAYGGTAPAYNPTNNSLFLVGHDYDQAIAEISIPEIIDTNQISNLRIASMLQPFTAIQPRIPDFTLSGETKIGGLQVVDNQLVGTFYEYYDANGDAVDSHFKLDSLNLATANVSGLYQVGNYGGGFVGGYMTPIPEEWQADLGAPYLTGQAALSIIGRTSAGPAAFGFDPAQLGNATAPATNLVSYPLAHPLRPETSTNPLFNLTTRITGVVIPPNTSSVIFFGSHGTGEYCYGESAACNDFVKESKGTHSVGGLYEYQAWAYDVHDLIDVKNGLKQSWQIQPYDVWTFDLPMGGARKEIGGIAFDSQSGRLYVSQQLADGNNNYPIINVFQLPMGQTTPTAPTISSVQTNSVGENSAVIQWNTNVPTTGRIEYGVTSSLGNVSNNAPLATSHSVALSGLMPNTSYSFRIRAQNADGVETVSSLGTFQTLAEVPPPSSSNYSYSNPRPLAAADPATTVTVSNVNQLLNAVNNLQSGQTIQIAPGTYDLNGVTDALYVPQGISNWAIRGATGNRDDVVIRGGGMTGTVSFGFWVGNSTNGTFADFTIDGVREHGIIANPGAHDILYHGLRMIDVGDQFIKSNPATAGQGNDRGVVEYSIFEYRSMAPDNYTNGVDVHGGDDWIVRYNLFKNFISPAGQAIAGPAVLFWNGSTNTRVDGNTFINDARGISLGLEDKAGTFDHRGGTITNNMFYRAAGLSGTVDVPIYVADSPDTTIYYNTVFDQGSYPNAIEYRFAATNNLDVRNNLVNKAIIARDGATGAVVNNVTTATAAMFVNPTVGNLHLQSTATTAINRGTAVGVDRDLDDQLRDAQPDIGADEFFATTTPNQAPNIVAQSFSIDENSANGTAVGSVLASDPEGQALVYSILSGNTSNAFAINATTGRLTVNNTTALDYETIARFSLTVQVADPQGLAKSAVVTIDLNDVNEHVNLPPVIANQSFSIDENSANGTAVGSVLASDPEGQALAYSILSGNTSNAFAINATTGRLTVNNTTALDYETIARFSLTVQVADPQGLAKSAVVTIDLNDVNEHVNLPPVIANQSFSIDENSANGTAVGSVLASDPEGQALAYSILSGNTSNAFAINATTGRLTVNNTTALDYETIARFSLTVQVADPQGLAKSAVVTIDLNDVNEHVNLPPVIANQSFSIDENSANGTAVGSVLASDPEGQALAYSILSGNTSNAFAINATTGRLTVNNTTALDYETIARFSLTVQVADPQGLAKSAVVTIDLNDVNEHVNLPPVIANQSFSIDENSANGTAVGSVLASDPEGQALAYSILSGNTSNAFAINATTGRLTVNNMTALDYETIARFSLTVQVADPQGLAKSAVVTIDLNDVNEHVNLPPVIVNQSFSINANAIDGTLVGTVLASDPEGEPLSFSILSGNTGNAFTINATTGRLTVNNVAALDFETLDSMKLTVQVADPQGLVGSAIVTISVHNLFELPVLKDQTFYTPLLASVGQSVGTVLASVSAAGGELNYAITGGNQGNVFALEATNGVLTVRTPLAVGVNPPPIIVTVTDQHGQSRSATMTVIIQSNLVSHFSLSEGSGSRTYDQDGRQGTLRGAKWTTGEDGGGLRFDGRNDWVTVADSPDLDFTTSFTLAMWVKPDSLGDWSTGMLKESRRGLAYGLYVSDNHSKPAVYVNLGGADLNATGKTALPLDVWSHLAATFDGRELKLFVNGILVAQQRTVGSVIKTGSPLRLGGNSVWGEYFDGDMDEVRLYNATLSAAEIGLLAKPSSQVVAQFAARSTPLEFATAGDASSLSAGGFVATHGENLLALNATLNKLSYTATVDEVFSRDFDINGLTLQKQIVATDAAEEAKVTSQDLLDAVHWLESNRPNADSDKSIEVGNEALDATDLYAELVLATTFTDVLHSDSYAALKSRRMSSRK